MNVNSLGFKHMTFNYKDLSGQMKPAEADSVFFDRLEGKKDGNVEITLINKNSNKTLYADPNVPIEITSFTDPKTLKYSTLKIDGDITVNMAPPHILNEKYPAGVYLTREAKLNVKDPRNLKLFNPDNEPHSCLLDDDYKPVKLRIEGNMTNCMFAEGFDSNNVEMVPFAGDSDENKPDRYGKISR